MPINVDIHADAVFRDSSDSVYLHQLRSQARQELFIHLQ